MKTEYRLWMDYRCQKWQRGCEMGKNEWLLPGVGFPQQVGERKEIL